MVQPNIYYHLLLFPHFAPKETRWNTIKGGFCLRPAHLFQPFYLIDGYQCRSCDKHRLFLPVSDGDFLSGHFDIYNPEAENQWQ